jgi:hypothetical protein
VANAAAALVALHALRRSPACPRNGRRPGAGEGRAAHPDHQFRSGDDAFLGDPPHEPQGWYSVFDVDESTKDLIRAHASALKTL